MWTFLRALLRIQETAPSKLDPIQLVSLLWCASEKLMIFDLRALAEVEEYPRTIPGALLTTHVDMHMLIPWVPAETIVILYATEDVPRHFAQLLVSSDGPKVQLLDGGLRSWWQAGLPMETVNVSERQSHGKV